MTHQNHDPASLVCIHNVASHTQPHTACPDPMSAELQIPNTLFNDVDILINYIKDADNPSVCALPAEQTGSFIDIVKKASATSSTDDLVPKMPNRCVWSYHGSLCWVNFLKLGVYISLQNGLMFCVRFILLRWKTSATYKLRVCLVQHICVPYYNPSTSLPEFCPLKKWTELLTSPWKNWSWIEMICTERLLTVFVLTYQVNSQSLIFIPTPFTLSCSSTTEKAISTYLSRNHLSYK